MIDYRNLQDLVVTALQSKVSELAAEKYPQKPSEYSLTHPEGVILVFFAGCSYDKPINNSQILQAGRANFNITLCLRDMVNDEKALEYVDKIISSLLGLEVENYTSWGRMTLETIQPPVYDEEECIWIYVMRFYIPHEILQQLDE